jgi:hypothetical protein
LESCLAAGRFSCSLELIDINAIVSQVSIQAA